MPDGIRIQIDQRHGFLGGAMKGAGIDDPQPAEPLVVGDVGVAVEKIVVGGIALDELPQQPGVVAMGDGDLLSGAPQLGEIAGTLDAEFARILDQPGTVEIAVSPDADGRDAGQEIEDAFPADVAAVNQELRPGGAERGDARGGGGDAIVRVAEDAQNRDISRYASRRA